VKISKALSDTNANPSISNNNNNIDGCITVPESTAVPERDIEGAANIEDESRKRW